MNGGNDAAKRTALVDLAAAFGRGTTSELTPDAARVAADHFQETVGRYLDEQDAAWEGDLRSFCIRYAHRIGEEAQARAGTEPITAEDIEAVIPDIFALAKEAFGRRKGRRPHICT